MLGTLFQVVAGVAKELRDEEHVVHVGSPLSLIAPA